jgi:hypothetical protein
MPFTPKRTLQAEALYEDPSFQRLSPLARYLMAGLLSYVDGQGRERAKPVLLRETFFEQDEGIDPGDVETMLLELSSAGWVALYSHEGRELMQIDPDRMNAFVAGLDKRNGRFPPPPEGHPTFTRPPSGAPRAEGREGAAEAGAEEWWQVEPDAWMEDPDLPPPVGCPRHPNGLMVGNCGPCGSARKSHDQYMRGEITHAQLVSAHRARPSRRNAEDDEP